MIKKCSIILIAFNVMAILAGAQIASPPSLAVGLSGLVGEKGNIDVQLLTEIISQKQDELKKEGIRRVMNNAVLNHSYAMWDFANHSLEMLLYSKNKKAIEKELAEYATNMVLVYGFAEAYLQASYQLGNSHLLECMKQYPAAANMDSTEWNSYKFNLQNLFNSGRDKKPVQLFWLSKLKTNKNDAKENFNSFFLDLVYDALKENKTIRDLGFFSEAEQTTTEIYQLNNKFYSERKNAGTATAFDQAATFLKKRIAEELDVFINNYYIMRITYFQNLSINQIFGRFNDSVITPSLNGMFSQTDSTLLPAFVKDSINDAIENILSVSENIGTAVRNNANVKNNTNTDSLATELNSCINFLRHLKAVAGDDLTNEDLLFIREKAMPLFLQLNMEYGTGQNFLNDLRKLVNFIYAKNILRIRTHLKTLRYNTKIADMPLDRYYDFVKLLTELHKLDKANTYDYVFNNIKQVSNLLPEGIAKKYLSVLTDNIERYAFINKEENKIEIDVEEILLQLNKRYSERNKNPAKFYLSLGLNQTLSINYKDKAYALKESDDSTANAINSLSFASEKIGVKLTILPLRNFSKKLLLKNEDKLEFRKIDPFISDLHLLVFGSGILYNIVNSKTSKNFFYPMVGYGAGLSFYNGLDANIFIAHPLLSKEKFGQSLQRRQLIGFALDIKFMEYIDAIRKKRAEEKSQSK